MVFKEVTSDLQPLLPAAASVDHDVPDEFIISVTDCEQKLSKLCVHKAMGPDNIPNWILKDFSYIIASPIAAIYNSSVRQSYVPPSWKQAEILPIPKVPQLTSLAKHLRPIALTPVLSKVLESFVVSCMREATVHSETQYGGIKDSSTTLALITMLHHVLQRLERKNTYARIFSKAFDHIDHNILLDKLKTNGVPQICVDWQKAFLTRRTQRVKLADTTSDWTEMAGGVPQGTLSGPENFLNMIDDLHTGVDDVKFVDDVTLYEVCDFNQLRDMFLRTQYGFAQLVNTATRNSAILDKLWTNMDPVYDTPAVLDTLGTSDHRMVLLKPSYDAILDTGNIQRAVVRRFTTNEKAAFASALSDVSWEHLYTMTTCEEQFNFFQRTMEELMVTHFPYKSVTRHTADKPWVTDYFRHLIRQRQRAIMSGDIDEARRLRNLVNRTAPKLRQRFYQSKIATLEETSSKDWWKHMKNLMALHPVTLTKCKDLLTSAPRAT